MEREQAAPTTPDAGASPPAPDDAPVLAAFENIAHNVGRIAECQVSMWNREVEREEKYRMAAAELRSRPALTPAPKQTDWFEILIWVYVGIVLGYLLFARRAA